MLIVSRTVPVWLTGSEGQSIQANPFLDDGQIPALSLDNQTNEISYVNSSLRVEFPSNQESVADDKEHQ